MKRRQARKIVKEHGTWAPVSFLVNGQYTGDCTFFSCGPKFDGKKAVRMAIADKFGFGRDKSWVYALPAGTIDCLNYAEG